MMRNLTQVEQATRKRSVWQMTCQPCVYRAPLLTLFSLAKCLSSATGLDCIDRKAAECLMRNTQTECKGTMYKCGLYFPHSGSTFQTFCRQREETSRNRRAVNKGKGQSDLK